MNLSEYRNQIKLFKSECCNAGFVAKSNGLYTYYVCLNCHKKTNAILGNKELDLYGRIKKRIKNKKL